jgi:hypothetical protein
MKTNLTSGNMFAAQCSYVSKVLAPMKFQQRTADIAQYIHTMKNHGTYQNDMYPWVDSMVGYGRYASEHWLCSHPDLVPCDVSETVSLQYWKEESIHHTYSDDEFVWSLAPRTNISDIWEFYSYSWKHSFNQTITQANVQRLRQYFLLRGVIYRWLTLYGTIASNTSWVWDWFPDGHLWRDAVQLYGNHTLERMITSTSPPPDHDIRDSNGRGEILGLKL